LDEIEAMVGKRSFSQARTLLFLGFYYYFKLSDLKLGKRRRLCPRESALDFAERNGRY
jgi:hypothetical protein